MKNAITRQTTLSQLAPLACIALAMSLFAFGCSKEEKHDAHDGHDHAKEGEAHDHEKAGEEHKDHDHAKEEKK